MKPKTGQFIILDVAGVRRLGSFYADKLNRGEDSAAVASSASLPRCAGKILNGSRLCALSRQPLRKPSSAVSAAAGAGQRSSKSPMSMHGAPTHVAGRSLWKRKAPRTAGLRALTPWMRASCTPWAASKKMARASSRTTRRRWRRCSLLLSAGAPTRWTRC